MYAESQGVQRFVKLCHKTEDQDGEIIQDAAQPPWDVRMIVEITLPRESSWEIRETELTQHKQALLEVTEYIANFSNRQHKQAFFLKRPLPETPECI